MYKNNSEVTRSYSYKYIKVCKNIFGIRVYYLFWLFRAVGWVIRDSNY